MRTLHKSWDNRVRSSPKARYKTWTRRVRWYVGQNDIRLNFEDAAEGTVNGYYKDEAAATADWEAFKKGLTIRELRAKHYGQDLS